MLLGKSTQLIELSQEKVQLDKYTKNKEGWKTRHQQITQFVRQITEIVEPLLLFRNQGLIASDFDHITEPLLKLVQSSLTAYKNEPEWIVQNFEHSKFQSSINKLTSSLNKELLQAWKNYLNRSLPGINSDLLNVLYNIKDFQSTVDQIRQLERQINLEKYPKYSQEFEYIKNLIQQLNNTWNNLNADNIPDEVLIFLKAAGRNTGASLDLLTPTVKTWLEDHNLSSTLRIRLS